MELRGRSNVRTLNVERRTGDLPPNAYIQPNNAPHVAKHYTHVDWRLLGRLHVLNATLNLLGPRLSRLKFHIILFASGLSRDYTRCNSSRNGIMKMYSGYTFS